MNVTATDNYNSNIKLLKERVVDPETANETIRKCDSSFLIQVENSDFFRKTSEGKIIGMGQFYERFREGVPVKMRKVGDGVGLMRVYLKDDKAALIKIHPDHYYSPEVTMQGLKFYEVNHKILSILCTRENPEENLLNERTQVAFYDKNEYTAEREEAWRISGKYPGYDKRNPHYKMYKTASFVADHCLIN